jgi:predicted RNase H-like nuclease (RuvC/YqgF family)
MQQAREIESVQYVNEKLRRELKEAQETIEDLMKEIMEGTSTSTGNGGGDGGELSLFRFEERRTSCN